MNPTVWKRVAREADAEGTRRLLGALATCLPVKLAGSHERPALSTRSKAGMRRPLAHPRCTCRMTKKQTFVV